VSKFIKVEAWSQFFSEGPWPRILNADKVEWVRACEYEKFNAVEVNLRGVTLYLKMSIDECLAMLNGVKEDLGDEWGRR